MNSRETDNSFVNENTMLTTADVMKILRIGKTTLWELISAGAIKGIRIGRSWRFSRENINRYMNGEPQK